jgi:Caspase domain
MLEARHQAGLLLVHSFAIACQHFTGAPGVGVTLRMIVLAAAFAATLVAVSASGALAEKRVALVVGNASYAALGTLANPTNDADDIASTLRGMGFEVTLAENADERQFTDVLSNFATAADGADMALFYYSGHGLQYSSENYLVPVDATLHNRFSLTHETIALNDVLSAMSSAHTALVYVDACRSFPLTGTFFASPNERVTPVAGLAPVQQVQNTFVGFSASPGQTARDGSGRNSPFTTAMLEELPKPGLDVAAMFSAVAAQVVSSTEGAQKPQSFSGISSDITLVAGASPAQDSAAADASERAYRDASAIGTIGAYRAFLARFPGGFYSELAREALNKLDASTPAGDVPPAPDTDSHAVASQLIDQFIKDVATLPAALKEPDLSYFGPSKERIGDWSIATSKNGCFMFTEATGASPDGWLTYRPWIYFGTVSKSTMVHSALIQSNASGGADLFAGGQVSAAVTRADGSTHAIAARFQGTELRVLVPCAAASDGKYCLDGGSLAEMMQATSLTLAGKTPAGKDAAITYSIAGYGEAAKRINELCKAKAGFLFAAPAAQ